MQKKEYEKIKFEREPVWIIIDQDPLIEISNVSSFKKVIEVDSGSKYRLLCCVISLPNHFQGIFYLNSSFWLIDDLANGYSQVSQDFEFKANSFVYVKIYE